MGKAIGLLAVLIAAGAAVMYASGLMTVRQTQDVVLPTVSISGGQMPKADVGVGGVDAGSRARTVEVPTTDVSPPIADDAAPTN